MTCTVRRIQSVMVKEPRNSKSTKVVFVQYNAKLPDKVQGRSRLRKVHADSLDNSSATQVNEDKLLHFAVRGCTPSLHLSGKSTSQSLLVTPGIVSNLDPERSNAPVAKRLEKSNLCSPTERTCQSSESGMLVFRRRYSTSEGSSRNSAFQTSPQVCILQALSRSRTRSTVEVEPILRGVHAVELRYQGCTARQVMQ
jgi:hypothetical protein